MDKPELDEIAAALVGLGSTLASTSTYEESVIKSKTLSTAPTLSGLNFPKLSCLCDTTSTVTLIQILKRIRSSIEKTAIESPEFNILRMKEQILMSYLITIKKMSEEEILGQGKREMMLEERKRAAAMQSSNKSRTQLLDGNKVVNVAEKRKKKVKFQKSEVLNDIKNFGSQALLERKKDINLRATCKKWRRNLFLGDRNEEKMDDSVTEGSLDVIKKLREERITRRDKFRMVRKTVKDRITVKEGITVKEETIVKEETENNIEDTPLEEVVAEVIKTKPKKKSTRKSVTKTQSSSDTMPCKPQSKRRPLRTTTVQQYTENSDGEGEEDAKHTTAIHNNDEEFTTDANDDDDEVESEEEIVIDEIDPDAVRATNYKDATNLDDFEEWSYDYRVEEWVETGISSMRSMSHLVDGEVELPGSTVFPDGLLIPTWIHNRLFPYQRTGIRWIWELHRQQAGGIVGDEMGLGKTVQICSYLGCLAASRKIQNALIVAPATLLRHWSNELAIWAPGLRRIVIHKSAQGARDTHVREATLPLFRSLDLWLKRERKQRRNEPLDEEDLDGDEEYQDTFCGTGYVLITTYENIRRSANIWTQHHWNYVILDEGQKIRNPDADVTLACKRFRTPHRLLLSGTPIQNNLRELWSLFDFTFPGRLGTLPTFESEFADPMKRGGYINASPMVVQIAYRCALVLRDLVNPYLLRRLKKDIPEVKRMPGKTEQVLFCRLSERQRSFYKAYLESDEVNKIIQGRSEHQNMTFRAITTLRKICNHPDLLCGPDDEISSFISLAAPKIDEDSDFDEDCEDMDASYFVERSGKLQVLQKILPLWKQKNHKVLIFCQWTKMLTIIQQFIIDQEWKFFRMDGKTSISSRQNLVDKFNSDPEVFVMLLTTRTGGVGLNLTGADKIIIYDPDWNPQTDAQAKERSYRFGQTRHVTIYRLITAGTIEEKIYHRQIFKTALSNTVLQDPKQRRLFSQKDLRDLFTLKEDSGDRTGTNKDRTETEEIIVRGNPKPDSDDNNAPPEDISSMLRSKGLAGVFNHDLIDNPNGKNANKSLAAREMEEQAIAKAQKAEDALEKSVSVQTPSSQFAPTWTGSKETLPKRFGAVRSKNGEGDDVGNPTTVSNFDTGFGGAALAGVSGKKRALSSGDFLRQLKHRQNKVVSFNV